MGHVVACRVFIADDVDAIRGLWRYSLEQHPEIEVVGEAGDGVTALAGVRRAAPDVLVLDLSMPGMDGLQVIRTLHGERPELRIVVASGFSGARLAPIALSLGAAAYFEKGGPTDRLCELVLETFRSAKHPAVRPDP